MLHTVVFSFQSYLRSNSDGDDPRLLGENARSFNPTLGLILTHQVHAHPGFVVVFQSYLSLILTLFGVEHDGKDTGLSILP